MSGRAAGRRSVGGGRPRGWPPGTFGSAAIACRGGVVAFVEVKARRTADEAAESLGPRQRRRVAGAASLWLASRPEEGRAVRFDVLLVAPWRMPRHIVDAFRPEA
ncbi:MAG: YraN family protein [Acetobacterales bacterium]